MSKNENKSFINETVVKKRASVRHIIKNLVKIVLSGIVFGVFAIAAAVFTKPYIHRLMPSEAESTSEEVIIPDDTIASSQVETTVAESTEPVEDIVASAMEKHKYSVADLKMMHADLVNIVTELDEVVVSVHSVKNNRDWFDNPMANEEHYTGIITAKTGSELLILCPIGATEEYDSIDVTFSDNTELSADIKLTDNYAGIAILTVGLDKLDAEVVENIEPVVLGNSYTINRGDILLAVGSPQGSPYSMSYGYVSHIFKNISVVDGLIRCFNSDMALSAEYGSFVVNLEGELVGWASKSYSEELKKEEPIILGISDFKSILEKMSNAKPCAYIGLKLVDIDRELIEDDKIKEGLYIIDVQTDSGAYSAGIQAGDVLSAIGDKSISSMADYKSQIENLIPGERAIITVYRNNGKDEYKKLEFDVGINSR